MVVPLILKEPLAAPAPFVKLALAGGHYQCRQLTTAGDTGGAIGVQARACRKLLVSGHPSTISEESVRVTLSPLTE